MPFENLTGIRIEAIPDKRFPSDGSGRAGSGNFVLSELEVTAGPVKITQSGTEQRSGGLMILWPKK